MPTIINASWLNNLYSSITTGLSAKNIITNINSQTATVGSLISASQVNTFINVLASARTRNTYLNHANWINEPTTVTQGALIIENYKTNLDTLITGLLAANGNNSVSTGNAVTTNSNNSISFSGNNISSGNGNLSGFSNTSAFDAHDANGSGNNITGNSTQSNRTCGNNSNFSGNANTGNFVCSQCSGNFSTFTAFIGSSKTANNGQGWSNNSQFSGFSTQSNRTCSNNGNFSGDANTGNSTQSNFSCSGNNGNVVGNSRSVATFSTCSNCSDQTCSQTALGGNSIGNSLAFSFSVKGDGTITTNSNVVAPTNE